MKIPALVHLTRLSYKYIKQKIGKCEEEIRELTKLHDWLLPMLMNR